MVVSTMLELADRIVGLGIGSGCVIFMVISLVCFWGSVMSEAAEIASSHEGSPSDSSLVVLGLSETNEGKRGLSPGFGCSGSDLDRKSDPLRTVLGESVGLSNGDFAGLEVIVCS